MTVTGFITAIVIGAIIGLLGRFVAPGKQNLSLVVTILVGIVAALLGTALANAISSTDTAGIDWIEVLLQVGLAAIGVTLVARRRGGRR